MNGKSFAIFLSDDITRKKVYKQEQPTRPCTTTVSSPHPRPENHPTRNKKKKLSTETKPRRQNRRKKPARINMVPNKHVLK